MNKNILKKCLEKLSEENPDISYVRGMLEALCEGLEGATSPTGYIPTSFPPGLFPPPLANMDKAIENIVENKEDPAETLAKKVASSADFLMSKVKPM